ncbi:unnamed protein product [Caenorhabditis bovis]|uniref:Apple domain-containing protein n=1 Tax=Caenorhabditis bovis TaxID=2654633 RepID=A0A8S1EJV1_9PELO|nr:unnamed protein product [Caenorhabditis bovis]
MLSYYYIIALLFGRAVKASNFLEDNSSEEHVPTFPTPPSIVTTPFKNVRDSSKSQIFHERDLLNAPSSSSYTSKRGDANTSNRVLKAKDEDIENRQTVAGIPDLTDPCFRRYENSIIVNAQPYERRSSIGLLHCKSHCLNSQSGIYSCRSFVYDNINQVCDLFAHVGDQAPARLLKFQTRDYFEPTDAYQCLAVAQKSADEFVAPPSPPIPEVSQTEELPLTTQNVARDEQTISEFTTTPSPSKFTQCPFGKSPTFLRTEGFELFKNDDEQYSAREPSECAELCISNRVNERDIDCKSFDYDSATSTCYFSSEAAVPVGNGQLKQKDETFYNEKICITSRFVEFCSSPFFSRHPQMILVGFAESVTDASTFEQCFDTCLNSFQLFGFNCTSGMYYFEETQLNCILNSENRQTQKDLFTDENTDIVDYFEVECGARKSSRILAGVKNYEVGEMGGEKIELAQNSDELQGARWETWSDCVDGKQTRRRSCTNMNKVEDCAEEMRDCVEKKPEDRIPTREEIAQVKDKIRREGFKCRLNECCRVFSTCSYGLRHNSKTKQLEWCKKPCEQRRSRLV